MKAIVVGLGSIGERHAGILSRLGLEVGTVSRHAPEGPSATRDLRAALARFAPTYVVIANETSRHLPTLLELKAAGYRGKVLVEKPVFQSAEPATDLSGLEVFVGYNLRFHPLLAKLEGLLRSRRIHSVQAYVGQHLSLWRRARSYQESYSSRREEGGGVLRDLSHELDFVTWLFGPCTELAANVGTFGDLGIEAEDSASLLLRTKRCPSVTVGLNYLDRVVQRNLTVNAEGATYRLDFVAGTLEGGGQSEKAEPEPDATYEAMHRASLEVGPARDPRLCTLEQGAAVVRIIEAAEAASRDRTWVRP